MTEPKVTVLTTVYNGLPYLAEAIESTLGQTYGDFTYLIVDDGSTDGSVDCVLSYKDPRIKLVRNEHNLGTSDTFNRGLSLCSTPYVVRLDQDDVSLPKRIEEQIAYLEANPDVAIVCSWEHTIDSNGKRIRDWKRRIENYGEFLSYVLLGLCPIWHPSIAFRKSAMDVVGGFNREYARAEDFDVTMRFALNRLNGAVVPAFHLLQREHGNRQSTQFNEKQASVARRIHEEALACFVKNGDAKALASFLRLEHNRNEGEVSASYLSKIKIAFDELMANVIETQRLSAEEVASMRRLIFRRVGYGLKYASSLVRLPRLFLLIGFYGASPLHAAGLRRVLSRLYHGVHQLRYLFK